MINKTIDVYWIINDNCNFNCPYCVNKSNEEIKINRTNEEYSLKKVAEYFDKNYKSYNITLAGGEPFLTDNIIEILKILTKKNKIFIFTNLSSDKIYEFASVIDPKKVIGINASLHLTELNKRNSVDDYIKKFKYLQNKEFLITSSIVMWPPIFPRFKDIYKKFKKERIFLRPVSYYGTYNSKEYPGNYSNKERKTMRRFHYKTLKNLNKNNKDYLMDLIDENLSLMNIACRSGKDHFIVEREGNIRRCLSDTNSLGNILDEYNLFKKDEVCKCKICRCHREGLRFSYNRDFWNKDNKIKNLIENIIR